MSVATKEEVDGLIKTVKDAADALKSAQGDMKASVEKMVEQALKSVLASHPGTVAEPIRKVEFPAEAKGSALEVIASMPEEAQKTLDDCFILSKILQRPVTSLKSWSKWTSKHGEFKKALDTAASGGGAEWIPTDFTTRLWELVRVQGVVAGLFTVIPMPTNPYKLPIELGRLKSWKHSEQNADTGQIKIPVSDVASLTGNQTLTAIGHGVRVLISKDLEEDSIVPMLPFLQSRIVMALAEGREDCIINGDTQSTHQDSDTTDASDRRKMWDGLRRYALANSYTTDLATLTLDNMRILRSTMGRYGVQPGELAHIMDLRSYIKALSIESITTLEKFGPNATVIKGQLGAIDGSPVVVTEWARNDLDSTGVNSATAANNIKGGLLTVNRMGFVIGERRNASVQLLKELYAESDQDALVIRERVIFDDTYPIASNATVALGYNVG